MLDKFLSSRKVNIASPMGRAISTASVIGLHMVVAVFIGFGFGFFLDKTFGTGPWLTIIFLLLGIVAGFKNMVASGRRLLVWQEKMDQEQRAKEIEATLNSLQQSGNAMRRPTGAEAGLSQPPKGKFEHFGPEKFEPEKNRPAPTGQAKAGQSGPTQS